MSGHQGTSQVLRQRQAGRDVKRRQRPYSTKRSQLSGDFSLSLRRHCLQGLFFFGAFFRFLHALLDLRLLRGLGAPALSVADTAAATAAAIAIAIATAAAAAALIVPLVAAP